MRLRLAHRTSVLVGFLLLSSPAPAPAQGRCPAPNARWRAALALAAVGAAAAVDARVDAHYVAHRTSTLDRVADVGNTIGAGHFVEPALGAAFLTSVLLRRPKMTRDVIAVTIAYAVGNGLVGVLKPIVGRRRPAYASSPWIFRPISGSGMNHSWPSSHVVHVSAVMAATASLSDNRAVDAAALAVMGLVGWSRVYSHQHWTSDVVSTALLGGIVAHATIGWARHRHLLPAEIRCPPDGASGTSTTY